MNTQRKRIIERLEQDGLFGTTNTELAEISLRYTAVISELRTMGYVIDCKEVGGVFIYVLVEKPETVKKQNKAVDLFYAAVDKDFGGRITTSQLRVLLEANHFNVVRNWGCNT